MSATVESRAPAAPTPGGRSPGPGPRGAGSTPLWAVFLLTFLCSIGSAVIYGGIFFLAKHEYGFGARENFGLGLLYGLTYIPAALSIGPLLRRLGRSGVSPRAVLGVLMVLMGIAALLPSGAVALGLAQRGGAGGPSWPLWAAIAMYSPLSGALWPIVESYLAGGRTEEQLRGATGRFNITWSGSIVVGMLAMGPLIERHALVILAALGFIHFACLAVVVRFRPAPATHEHHAHERPAAYHRLLEFLRLMLPVAFMFISTLSPYLPGALAKLGVPARWETALAAVWYAARVVTFFALERWSGWHGRWATPVAGALLLLASFAALLIAPAVLGRGPGLGVLIAALATFGVGVGIIYAAALYYAMEVGSSGVDAGGMHETLIGVGYTAGPAIGLLAMGTVQGLSHAGGSMGDRAGLVMLAIVSGVAVAVGGWALWRANHLSRLPSARGSDQA